jgi:CPA1 family monovalent cation:H+ antiporter
VLVWGGIRGSLSMVLVLGLPADFSGRALLINLVFGVVSVSLFLQGLSMAPLMRRLGLTPSVREDRDYEVARGRALASRQVLLEAEQELARGVPDEGSYRQILEFYREQRDWAQADLLEHASRRATPERLLEAARSLALIEREALNHGVAAGVVSEAACAELLAALDTRLSDLDEAAHQGGSALERALSRLYSSPPRHPKAPQ